MASHQWKHSKELEEELGIGAPEDEREWRQVFILEGRTGRGLIENKVFSRGKRAVPSLTSQFLVMIS